MQSVVENDIFEDLRPRIVNGRDLLNVIRELTDIETRFAVMRHFQAKISDGFLLGELLSCFPAHMHLQITQEFTAKIRDSIELSIILGKFVSLEDKLVFIESQLEKLSTGFDLARILIHFPRRPQFKLIENHHHLIQSTRELSIIFPILEIETIAQQLEFVEKYCDLDLNFEFCLNHKINFPLLPTSVYVQEKLRLNHFDVQQYLGFLATHDESQADFLALLNAKHINLFQHLTRGKTLFNLIQNSMLAEPEKDFRQQAYWEKVERLRIASASKFLGVHFDQVTIVEDLSILPPLAVDFSSEAEDIPPGLSAHDFLYFLHLYSWLSQQAFLSIEQKRCFEAFKTNSVIYDPRYFEKILKLFAKLCSKLDAEHAKGNPICLPTELLGGLSLCHAGVWNCLEDLILNLQSLDQPVFNILQIYIKGSGRGLNRILGVLPDQEVHLPLNPVYHYFGIRPEMYPASDPYAINLHVSYIQTWGRQTLSLLDRKTLIDAAIPSFVFSIGERVNLNIPKQLQRFQNFFLQAQKLGYAKTFAEFIRDLSDSQKFSLCPDALAQMNAELLEKWQSLGLKVRVYHLEDPLDLAIIHRMAAEFFPEYEKQESVIILTIKILDPEYQKTSKIFHVNEEQFMRLTHLPLNLAVEYFATNLEELAEWQTSYKRYTTLVNRDLSFADFCEMLRAACYEFEIDSHAYNLLYLELESLAENHFVKIGVIEARSEDERRKSFIWERLITEFSLWHEEEQVAWADILQHEDAWPLIKNTIMAHEEEKSALKLSVFLAQTAPNQSLIQCIIGDVFACEWAFGFRIEHQEAGFSFISEEGYLTDLFLPLASSAYQLERECLLERSLHQSGSLWYWLYHLQQLPGLYLGLFSKMMETIYRKGCWHYNSLPQVLHEMQKPHHPEESKILARSFRMERLQQQANLNLWDAYWQTALQIKGFVIDWELVCKTPNMLASLTSNSNAAAFLTLISLEPIEKWLEHWLCINHKHSKTLMNTIYYTFRHIDPSHKILGFFSPTLLSNRGFFSEDTEDVSGLGRHQAFS